MLYLGVDGGNTKTLALAADPGGQIVGWGRAGCGDIYGAESSEAALTAIAAAVHEALAMAGCPASGLVAGAFSLAGADWPEDFALLEAALRQYGFGRSITIVNDAIGALRAGTPDGCGVAVVCGTGAAIGARAPDGRIWHSSFWQEPHGAGELTNQALRAVYRAELGIDAPTALTGRALRFFQVESVEALLHMLTARDLPRPPHLRQFARELLDAAQTGDPTARRIVERHGAGLGDYALTAARKVGLIDQQFPLVLAGGVLRHPAPILRAALINRVQTAAPGAIPLDSRLEPAVGALILAIESGGTGIAPVVLEQITATLPETGFFAT
jgi:N-acetylglucosamine kinase-like BadF-type ATPase